MGAVSGPGSGAGTLAQPGSTSTGASLAGSITKPPTDNADNTQGQNVTQSQSPAARAAAQDFANAANPPPNAGESLSSGGGSLISHSIFSNLGGSAPVNTPAPQTLTSAPAPETITPPKTTAAPAIPNVVNTGQTVASQLAAGGTVTGAIVVGTNGQVINAGAGGSYSPSGPSYASLSPTQLSEISSGTGLTTVSTPTATAAPTSGGTASTGSPFTGPAQGSFATGGVFNTAAAENAGFTVTQNQNYAGGYALSRGGQQYDIYGNPIYQVNIQGATISTPQQQDQNNYQTTVTLANGTKLPVTVNIPVSYNQVIRNAGPNDATTPGTELYNLIQQIALGDLVGTNYTTTTASATPTTQTVHVDTLLANSGIGSGYTFNTNPGSPVPTLTIQYSPSGQAEGFVGAGTPYANDPLLSSVPSLTASAEGYTFSIVNGQILISQNGQNVGAFSATPAGGIVAGNTAATLGQQAYASAFTPGLATYAANSPYQTSQSVAQSSGQLGTGLGISTAGGNNLLGIGLSPDSYAGQLDTTKLLGPLPTPIVLPQSTNTNQTVSSNPTILGVLGDYPSAIASELGGIANYITGPKIAASAAPGSPLAGGQFPYNYPLSISDINNLPPILRQAALNQYQGLAQQYGTAYPQTLTNAAYQYLGSPSYLGPQLLPTTAAALGSAAGRSFVGGTAIALPLAVSGGLAGLPAVAAGSAIGAGGGFALNPLLDYYLGGVTSPEALAQAAAQGTIYGGYLGAVLPGGESVLKNVPGLGATEGIAGTASKAARGALSSLGFTNAYNLLAQGKPAGAVSDVFSGILGAGIPLASPYVSPYLDIAAAKLSGTPILNTYSLADYVDTFGSNPQVQDYSATLADFDADPTKAFVFADSTGNIARLFYNDVHTGYANAQTIYDYLQGVGKANEGNINLATTSGQALPNKITVEGQNPAYLGGVRQYAYGPEEGMYFNVPTKGGQAIQLNYAPDLMANANLEGSQVQQKFTLNPFGARATMLSTGVTPQDIAISSIQQFEQETGENVNTPAGKTAFSQWLAEQTRAQGKQFYSPYQNYFPGTDEIQVMKLVNSDINALESNKVLILNRNEEGPLKSVFVKLVQGSSTGQKLDTVIDSLTPAEQGALADAYIEAAAEKIQISTRTSPPTMQSFQIVPQAMRGIDLTNLITGGISSEELHNNIPSEFNAKYVNPSNIQLPQSYARVLGVNPITGQIEYTLGTEGYGGRTTLAIPNGEPITQQTIITPDQQAQLQAEYLEAIRSSSQPTSFYSASPSLLASPFASSLSNISLPSFTSPSSLSLPSSRNTSFISSGAPSTGNSYIPSSVPSVPSASVSHIPSDLVPSPSYLPSASPSFNTSNIPSPYPSAVSVSPSTYPYTSYLPAPSMTKKEILPPSLRQTVPVRLPTSPSAPVQYETQYAPSLTTTLLPQLTPNVTNPDTAILGVGLRGAYQAPGLDNPTSGVPTPSDTALQEAIQNAQLGAISPNLLSTPPQPQSLANAQITQENANLTQPATPSSPSYLQNPQYYGELEQSLLQQQNANLVQDASRNYQNSLFGQGILQNLGQGMSFTDLQALIKSQEDLANAQYNAQSQPNLAEEAANIPSAYANQNVYAQVPAEVRRRLEDVGVEVPQPAYA